MGGGGRNGGRLNLSSHTCDSTPESTPQYFSPYFCHAPLPTPTFKGTPSPRNAILSPIPPLLKENPLSRNVPSPFHIKRNSPSPQKCSLPSNTPPFPSSYPSPSISSSWISLSVLVITVTQAHTHRCKIFM